MIKAIVCRPNEPAEAIELEPDLATMQALVRGYVEAVAMDDGVTLWCNEDGLSLELPFNRVMGGHQIVGTLLLTRTDSEGETTSLTPEDFAYWLPLLNR